MDQHIYEDFLEQVDLLIESMSDYDGELYLAIEVAHQLRDEIARVEPEDNDDE